MGVAAAIRGIENLDNFHFLIVGESVGFDGFDDIGLIDVAGVAVGKVAVWFVQAEGLLGLNIDSPGKNRPAGIEKADILDFAETCYQKKADSGDSAHLHWAFHDVVALGQVELLFAS